MLAKPTCYTFFLFLEEEIFQVDEFLFRPSFNGLGGSPWTANETMNKMKLSTKHKFTTNLNTRQQNIYAFNQ